MNAPTPRILVLDDEEAVRTGLVLFLEDDEFEVLSASSAEEALALLEERPVDVAIVDIRLPGMDGDAFIQEAHRTGRAANFLIHTGSTNYSLPPVLRALGISRKQVFRKPVIDMAIMSEAIRNLVGRCERPRSAGGRDEASHDRR